MLLNLLIGKLLQIVQSIFYVVSLIHKASKESAKYLKQMDQNSI